MKASFCVVCLFMMVPKCQPLMPSTVPCATRVRAAPPPASFVGRGITGVPGPSRRRASRRPSCLRPREASTSRPPSASPAPTRGPRGRPPSTRRAACRSAPRRLGTLCSIRVARGCQTPS
ncbi:hypothetical protein M885DRAFT_551182 [Pelagophyceae sp. CCMP2097]|nr:hypothetical protein M885DRAFT_551182 [Pelagophyceae sp. CCMP2097]